MLLLLFRPPVAVRAAAAVGGRHLQRRQDDGGRVPNAKDNVGAEDVLHAHGSKKKESIIHFWSYIVEKKSHFLCKICNSIKGANVYRRVSLYIAF